MMNNILIEIPEEIFTIQALKVVDFSGNKLKFIPERLCDAVNLVEINFTGNKIKAIPQDLQNLTKLENIYLSNNEIEDITPVSRFSSSQLDRRTAHPEEHRHLAEQDQEDIQTIPIQHS